MAFMVFTGDNKGIVSKNAECITKSKLPEVLMQYRQAFLDARRVFGEKDPCLMADLAKGYYNEDNEIELSYLNQLCRITHPAGEIHCSGGHPLSHEEMIIMYQYLAGASGLPTRDRWLSFLELPGGPHHFAPFQHEAIFPLANIFGSRPLDFLAAAKSLGGIKADFAHSSAVIPVFPRLPLAFMLWVADEEFPASANILFDASAQTYLPTASLYMLGIAVAKRLLAGA
jgi:hypothetical protein